MKHLGSHLFFPNSSVYHSHRTSKPFIIRFPRRFSGPEGTLTLVYKWTVFEINLSTCIAGLGWYIGTLTHHSDLEFFFLLLSSALLSPSWHFISFVCFSVAFIVLFLFGKKYSIFVY